MSKKEDEFDWAALESQMASVMPTSFGKKEVVVQKPTMVSYDETKREVAEKEPVEEDAPPAEAADVDSDNEFILPISHEIVLKDHEHMVTALSIDPAGSRVVSGGRDEYVKMWDFNGMDATCRAFLQVDKISGGMYLFLLLII